MAIERTHISDIMLDAESIADDMAVKTFNWEAGQKLEAEFDYSSVDETLTSSYFDHTTCSDEYSDLYLVSGKALDTLESEDTVLGMSQHTANLIHSTVLNTIGGLVMMGLKNGYMITVDHRMLATALTDSIKQSLYDDNVGEVTKYLDN